MINKIKLRLSVMEKELNMKQKDFTSEARKK